MQSFVCSHLFLLYLFVTRINRLQILTSVPAISVTVTVSAAFAQILMVHFFACACEDTQATAKVVLVLVPVRIFAPNFWFSPLLYMVEKNNNLCFLCCSSLQTSFTSYSFCFVWTLVILSKRGFIVSATNGCEVQITFSRLARWKVVESSCPNLIVAHSTANAMNQHEFAVSGYAQSKAVVTAWYCIFWI